MTKTIHNNTGQGCTCNSPSHTQLPAPRMALVLGSLEGVAAEEHGVQHHPCGPHIRKLAVVALLVGEHLWRNIALRRGYSIACCSWSSGSCLAQNAAQIIGSLHLCLHVQTAAYASVYQQPA